LGNKFDSQSFGVGFGAIMAGGGAGLWLKKDTQPPAGNQNAPQPGPGANPAP